MELLKTPATEPFGGIFMSAKAVLTCRPNSHSFEERTLTLNQPTKVGRCVGRNKPASNNAIFDSKVLSRKHALLWFENGKFFIKDTKSSNGTFLNYQRLSKGSEESAPWEVLTGDVLQFGVDVMEIVEEKVRCTHSCILATVQLFLPEWRESEAVTYAEMLPPMIPTEITIPASDFNQLLQNLHISPAEVLENEMPPNELCICSSCDCEGACTCFRESPLSCTLSLQNSWNPIYDESCSSYVQNEVPVNSIAETEYGCMVGAEEISGAVLPCRPPHSNRMPVPQVVKRSNGVEGEDGLFAQWCRERIATPVVIRPDACERQSPEDTFTAEQKAPKCNTRNADANWTTINHDFGQLADAEESSGAALLYRQPRTARMAGPKKTPPDKQDSLFDKWCQDRISTPVVICPVTVEPETKKIPSTAGESNKAKKRHSDKAADVSPEDGHSPRLKSVKPRVTGGYFLMFGGSSCEEGENFLLADGHTKFSFDDEMALKDLNNGYPFWIFVVSSKLPEVHQLPGLIQLKHLDCQFFAFDNCQQIPRRTCIDIFISGGIIIPDASALWNTPPSLLLHVCNLIQKKREKDTPWRMLIHAFVLQHLKQRRQSGDSEIEYVALSIMKVLITHRKGQPVNFLAHHDCDNDYTVLPACVKIAQRRNMDHRHVIIVTDEENVPSFQRAFNVHGASVVTMMQLIQYHLL